MINKCLLVGLLCIAFLLGVVQGYYVHEGINEATVNIRANKIISDNYNISMNRSNINFSNAIVLCGDTYDP